MSLLNDMDLLPAALIYPFAFPAFYLALLPFHGLTVQLSGDEIVESWFVGKGNRFLVSDIRELTIVKINDDFDLIQFQLSDGSLAQIKTDEPEKLLVAIESVISSAD